MKKMYDSRVIFKKKMIEAKKQYEKTPTIEPATKEIALIQQHSDGKENFS